MNFKYLLPLLLLAGCVQESLKPLYLYPSQVSQELGL
ncbi:hypothetical protein QFZ45_004860 [Pseudomonas synxantha]|nr:hypothetical protein [Pseudomonas synxantha]